MAIENAQKAMLFPQKKHFPFPTNIRIFVCFALQSLMNELIYL